MTQTDQPAGPTTPTPELSTDILGEPWLARRINVTIDDKAAPGADHAVLVHQKGAVTASRTAPRHSRAVLYIHGRNDYFFQTWLADAFLEAGYEFYALDLRACGRAGSGYPWPHDVRDLRVHDEEINEALRIIREEHGHHTVVLNGHSTGGLQAVIWAADHPGGVRAVTLNSPWLQLNSGSLIRSYGSAYIDLVSRRDPARVVLDFAQEDAKSSGARDEDDELPPLENDVYARVLHKRWGGEWDWDLSLKPTPSVPVRAGFLAGVRRLQREVKHGLDIKVPVLVCCSTTSGGQESTPEEALRSDVVLSVEQIIERSACLGRDVTIRQVPGGVHDLALSPSPAREEYMSTLTGWLAVRLG